MYAEGKLLGPERFDSIWPLWRPATIERWANREWWGGRGVGVSDPASGTTAAS